MAPPDCDVLIVGAGPTGLTLGLLLVARGISVVIAEKEAGPYPLPRAAHIDHQVLRVFQEVGIADRIVATCRQTASYDFLNADGQVLLRFEGLDRIASGGWPASNMIHQPSIEQALRDVLADEPGIEVRPGWRFLELRDEAEAVAAAFETPEGMRTIRARYLVGADGARSPVRDAAGIAIDDLQFNEPWLVIDAIVRDVSRLPKINLQICNPERPTTSVLMGEGRHRWEFMIKPGEMPEEMLDDAKVEQLLAPWQVDGAVEIERKAIYRFHARIAGQWRKERVLLAGDAAHQMPPFAGQGLCSGVRDAANLGWKLAAVLRDAAPSTLLDTYQPERELNVRAITNMAMMMGRTVCITCPDAAAQRDQQLLAARAAGQSIDRTPDFPTAEKGCVLEGSPGAGHYFPQGAAADGARLDDVLGSGAWLVARTGVAIGAGHSGLTAIAADAALLNPFAAQISAWLEAHTADAVLVRPDRHVFGTGTPDVLLQAWRKATRRVDERL